MERPLDPEQPKPHQRDGQAHAASALRPPEGYLPKPHLSDRDLASLGIKHENLRFDYPTFDGAPTYVLDILARNLRNPALTEAEVVNRREGTTSLIQASDNSEVQERLKAISSLVNAFVEAAHEFKTQLRFLRNNHYPRSCNGPLFRYDIPTPENARVVLSLGRCIGVLLDIRARVADVSGVTNQRLLARIDRVLAHKDIKEFVTRPAFLEFARDFSNSYLLGNHAGVKELLANCNSTLARDDLKQRYGETCSYDKLWDADYVFRLSLEQDQIGIRQGQELCNHFKDIWQIRPLANSYLRAFPFRMLQEGLSRLDYHVRCARMVLEHDSKFAEIKNDTPAIALDRYVNPSLRPASAAEARPGQDIESIVAMPLGAQAPGTCDQSPESPAIVPLTINELTDETRAILLSGANRSGKTVTAQSIGRAVVENQAGLPLGCEAANLSIFKRIEVLSPARPECAGDLGFFCGGVQQLAGVATRAGPGDLIIVDEVPGGSDRKSVVAVGAALFEQIVASGAFLIATHHDKQLLQRVAQLGPVVLPLQMGIAEDGGEITPTFLTQPGIAVHSHGIDLMSKTGFDPRTIQLARAYYLMLQENRFDTAPQHDLSSESAVSVPENPFYIDRYLLSDITRLTAAVFGRKFFAIKDEWGKYQRKLQGLLLGGARISDSNQTTSSEGLLEFRDLKKDTLLVLHTKLAEIFRWRADYIHRLNNYLANGQLTAEAILKGLAELRGAIPTLSSLDGIKGRIQDQIDTGSVSGKNEDWSRSLFNLLSDLDLRIGTALALQSGGLRPTSSDSTANFSLSDAKPFVKFQLVGGATETEQPNISVDDGVPQRVHINQGSSAAIVLGPNGSGKSTLNRSLSLNCVLAIGTGYAAADVNLAGVSHVYSFSGASSDTSNGQSYFSDALNQLSRLVQLAQPDVLLILDELLGSDPVELAAIQLAIVKRATEKGAKVILNTHIRGGLAEIGQREGYTGWKTDYEIRPDLDGVKPSFTLTPDDDFSGASLGLHMAGNFLTPQQYSRAISLSQID